MKLFGHAAESDIDRDRREQAEAAQRANRDQIYDAGRRAREIEADRRREWDRIQSEGHARVEAQRAQLRPGLDDSPDARAARTEASQLAGELEMERRRRHRALRERVGQEAVAARNAKVAAAEAGDVDGYVEAFNRLGALERLIRDLDEAERVRQQAGATQVVHGIVHGAGRSG
jgi:hypothetical protein